MGLGNFDNILKAIRGDQELAGKKSELGDGTKVGGVPKISTVVKSDKDFKERQYALNQLFGKLNTNDKAIDRVVPEYEKQML